MTDFLNITILEDLFFKGFLNVFGNNVIVILFAMAFLAFLCISVRLGLIS